MGGERIMKNVKGLLVVSLIIGLSIFMFIQNHSLNELKSEISMKQSLIDEIEVKLEEVGEQVNSEQMVNEVRDSVISAKQIGAEMIEIDNTLTEFYQSWEPFPEDEELLQKLEEAKKKNTELTGASEQDHIATWQLNPEWTLTLETVLNYGDVEQIPVLFRMTTAEGEFAGIVRATYNVREHKLTDIRKQYTPVGERDRVV